MVGLPKLRQAHYVTAVGLLVGLVAISALSFSAAMLLLPAFLTLFILSLGYFPGEELIERFRSMSRRPRPAARPVGQPLPELPDFMRPVGRMIAFALAVRPPPTHS